MQVSNPTLESNVDGFQDEVDQFDEIDQISNNDDDPNFFAFPNHDDTKIFGSEVQWEHHLQFKPFRGSNTTL